MAVWSFTSDCSLIAAKYQCEFVDIVLLFDLYYLKKKRSIEPASFPFSFLPDFLRQGVQLQLLLNNIGRQLIYSAQQVSIV